MSRPSVCIVASIELSTMPILVGQLLQERKSAAWVNAVMEASSITALTWFSNSTGSTMTFCGTTLNNAEPIGTACAGMSVISKRRLSAAHCPINPWPILSRSGWPVPPSSA